MFKLKLHTAGDTPATCLFSLIVEGICSNHSIQAVKTLILVFVWAVCVTVKDYIYRMVKVQVQQYFTKPNHCIWPIRTHYTLCQPMNSLLLMKKTLPWYSGLQLLPSYIHDPWWVFLKRVDIRKVGYWRALKDQDCWEQGFLLTWMSMRTKSIVRMKAGTGVKDACNDW